MCKISCTILLLALVACKGAPEREDNAAATLWSKSTRIVTSLQEIEGFWLIERFEDFEPSWRNDTPWRSAYVQIGDSYLTYSVGCNQSGNPAFLGRDGILQDTGDGSRMQTLEGCGNAREARDSRFFAFFGSNAQIQEFDEDRVLLRSADRELILIRPERWRQIHKPELAEIEGRWVPQMSTTYDGWESEGFGFGDDSGVVTIDRKHVIWSSCPNLPIPIRWTSDGRLAAQTSFDVSDCPVVTRTTDDGPSVIMDILAANPAVIRTGLDRIVLIDGSGEKGRRIDLRSEESIINPPPPSPLPKGYDPPPIPPPPPVTNEMSKL